ncbi:MAG TPA: helix-turn-helix domain-containing protein [Acidimicrobiales bacterium]|nr:helix-turn-helix domain-containing protein [Acidimicrobiales bacterium]
MRSGTFDAATPSDSDDLLTTGEAAALLNTSRQHIVDLCNAGDIPFSTVGRHRRVRRGDIETLRTRTGRLTKDQLRSLWLGHAVAGKLVLDPEGVLAKARENLELQRTRARGRASHWLVEWDKLLEGPIGDVLVALTSPVPRSRELRQNSPFSGVLSEDERLCALGAFGRVNRSPRS